MDYVDKKGCTFLVAVNTLEIALLVGRAIPVFFDINVSYGITEIVLLCSEINVVQCGVVI